MHAEPIFLVNLLFVTTALLYGAASVLFIAYLGGSEKVVSAGRIAPRLVGVAAVLHTVHLVVASVVYRVCPVEGVHFAMSVVSVVTCGAYLAMRVRYRIDVVGAFVAPFALTFFLASRFVGMGGAGDEPTSRMTRAILPIHVTVNVVGEALFMLSFAAAVAYLVQEKQLKAKRKGGLLQKLPPLDALDRAEHRFLLAGFPFLTIGILTGTTWARKVEAGSSAEIARAVFGYASWFLFAAVLLLRAAAGWRGRRAAYGTIAGFGFAVLLLVFYLFRTTQSGGPIAAALP
ncbi:MAG: cytochrome c biogenesis protein CcsA [Polyangiaceae bacterium]